MQNTHSCTSYEPSSIEIFIPSMIIFSQLCMSTDRTSLFIMSLLRIIFYVILYHVIDNIIDLDYYYIIKYVILLVIFLNIIYLGIVIAKKTVFSIGTDKSIMSHVIH